MRANVKTVDVCFPIGGLLQVGGVLAMIWIGASGAWVVLLGAGIFAFPFIEAIANHKRKMLELENQRFKAMCEGIDILFKAMEEVEMHNNSIEGECKRLDEPVLLK